MLPPLRKQKLTKIKTEHGKKISILHKKAYRLKEPTTQLLTEWNGILKHMTSDITLPGFKRNSSWRLKDKDDYHREVKPWCIIRDKTCVTGDVAWNLFSSFFGWLTLHENLGGKNISLENLSHSYLSDANLVWEYLTWRRDRSGAYTAETSTFINKCMALIRKETGWLEQNPEIFSARITTNNLTWPEWCDKNHNIFSSILNDLFKNKLITEGRDPKSPINLILETEHPMNALHELRDRMRADINQRSSSPISTARQLRDELLINLLSTNPLRINMYAVMTYRENGTGNLFKTKDGEWRLFFKSHQFKNEKGAANEDYSVSISKDVWPLIDNYIKNYHHLLLNGVESDIVFPVFPQHNNKKNWGRCTEYIGQCVTNSTLRYIPDYSPSGFGPQAFRHIIATDYLKNNPNGFQIVANVLHDKIETVMKNYAHLKVADGMSHFLKYAERCRAEYLKSGN